VRNRNAVSLAVAPNQNFDHVRDGSMLLIRRNAKRFFSLGSIRNVSVAVLPVAIASPETTVNVLHFTVLTWLRQSKGHRNSALSAAATMLDERGSRSIRAWASVWIGIMDSRWQQLCVRTRYFAKMPRWTG
jgi:hypothetical protein